MAPKIDKRTQITEKICVDLCKMKESNPSWMQKELAKWLEDTHGVTLSQSTISKTIKRSIDHKKELISNPNAKHLKQITYHLMEFVLYEWFVFNQEHVNISGELLKENGSIFLNQLYPEPNSFEFSNGWLGKFKQRHPIHSFRRFGERGSVDMEKIEATLPLIREELDKWAWKDIYNMDATGLFYRMQADNFLATKQFEGRKQNKQRITIVVCCNGDGDGSAKVPFWVIGKFLNPRCFKNVNHSTLNCTYRANSNAWMTSLLFLEWLKWFDSRLTRNVLLFMDNCSAHGKKENIPPLRHTTVMFLPPNSTFNIQPCDAGIIRNFKGYYRRRFNRLLLKRIEDHVMEPEKLSILDRIVNAVATWSMDVKPRIIANCFKHCKIRTPDVDELQVTNEMDEENQMIFTDLNNHLKELHYTKQMDMNVFFNHPSEKQITHALTEEEIITAIRQEAEGDNLEDDSIEIPKVSCQEALSMLDKLEYFGFNKKEFMRMSHYVHKI